MSNELNWTQSGRSMTLQGDGNSPLGINPSVNISQSWGLAAYAGVLGIGFQITYNSSNQPVLNVNGFVAGLGLDLNVNLSTKTLQTLEVGGMAGIGFEVGTLEASVFAKAGFGMDTTNAGREAAATLQIDGSLGLIVVGGTVSAQAIIDGSHVPPPLLSSDDMSPQLTQIGDGNGIGGVYSTSTTESFT